MVGKQLSGPPPPLSEILYPPLLFVHILMCTPRGGSKLTPQMYISTTAIISFYELPLISKIKPNFYIP